MLDAKVKAAAEEAIKQTLKTRCSHLLDRAISAGSRAAHTLVLARNIDANTAAHLIADVWLQGWLAAKQEEDERAG